MKTSMTIYYNTFTAISVMLPGNKFFRVHINEMEDTIRSRIKSVEKRMESVLSFCEVPVRRKNRKPFCSYDRTIKIRLTNYVYTKRRSFRRRQRRPLIIKKKCDCMRFNVSDVYNWGFNIDSMILEDNYDRAHEICNRALNFDGSDVLALVKNGYIYFEEEKFEDSLFYYDKALEIEPKDFVVIIYKGNALCKLGRYDEGIECFDKVLEGDPQNTTALHRKIEVLVELERYEEALKCYDEITGIEPEYLCIWVMKAEVFMEWKKYDEALKYYNELSEIYPCHNIWCLDGKGRVYYELKDYEKALECYDKILEIEPENKWSLMAMKEILWEMEQEI